MSHIIELVKPTPEQNNRRYDERRKQYVGEQFDRGERIIMVDGVRWGRTIVTMHGCHGTKHVFKQERGEVIDSAVRSSRRQKWLGEKDNWRPTEERVLEKVKELIAAGRLRHPDAVKAEQERAAERFQKRVAEREMKRAEEFRAKAMEALQINDPTSEIIDRVVAAMEWAQSR